MAELITTATAIKVATSLLKTFKTDIEKVVGKIWDESKFKFGDAIQIHLESQYEKYKNAKTFLHRIHTIPFEKIYFPTTVECKLRDRTSYKIDTSSVNTFFKSGRFQCLIGRAGSGKTMLVKHLFINTIESNYKIPLLIELRKLNDFKGNLFEYIITTIMFNELTPNKNIAKKILTSGKFVFFLDGYDEIFSNNKEKVIDGIFDFIDKYQKNDFLITSRPGTNAENFERFNNIYVQDLNEEEINKFCEIQCGLLHKEEDFRTNLLQTIFESSNSAYQSFLCNPLILSMFILTFESYPEIPKKKSKFYFNVIETLCIKHDSENKSSFQHEKKSGLILDDIIDFLEIFCFISFKDGVINGFSNEYLDSIFNMIKSKFNFTAFENNKLITDLSVNLALLIKDGLEYKFPHRSLQEYLAVKFIAKQNTSNQSKILKSMFKKSNDFFELGNFNNLCFELMRISFIENLILPNYNSLLQNACILINENDVQKQEILTKDGSQYKHSIFLIREEISLLVNNMVEFEIFRFLYKENLLKSKESFSRDNIKDLVEFGYKSFKKEVENKNAVLDLI